MHDCYSAEFLLIFSDEILLSKSEGHLKKIIESNMSFTYTIDNDEDKITYDGQTYNIKIKKNNSDVKKYRSYTIKTKIQNTQPSEDEKVKYDKFNSLLLETIKEIKHSQLNILRDDIASEYCTNGYVLIHDIENKMRKLITLFMTTKVGLEWVVASTPPSVVNSIKNNEAKQGLLSFSNFISETDFIQLSGFLFNKYSPINVNDVYRELQKEEVNLDDLRDFVPKSNWERHFSSLIATKESNILKLWERLYALRNKIAHNRFITFEEFRTLKSNKEKMDVIINDALDKLDRIEVSTHQKETIKSEMEVKKMSADMAIDNSKWKVDLNLDKLKNDPSYIDRFKADVDRVIDSINDLLYSLVDSVTKENLLSYKRDLTKRMERISKDDVSMKVKMLTSINIKVTANNALNYIQNINSVI